MVITATTVISIIKKIIDIQPDTSFGGIILCRWGTSVSDEA